MSVLIGIRPKIPTVKDEIYKFRSKYNARVNNHYNP